MRCIASTRLQSHKRLVDGVVDVARRVQGDKELTALIRRKFAIKCTTGGSMGQQGRGGEGLDGTDGELNG